MDNQLKEKIAENSMRHVVMFFCPALVMIWILDGLAQHFLDFSIFGIGIATTLLVWFRIGKELLLKSVDNAMEQSE